VADLAKALSDGFVYDGRFSPFRRRRHGNSAVGQPGHRLVVYAQNHDQVANGSQGARIAERLDVPRQRLAATLLVASPNVPLLFMGQEYGETNPFYYFVDHGDDGLSDAVRRGRRTEFEEFGFDEDFADPTTSETFERSKLDWSQTSQKPHAQIFSLYRELLRLRRNVPALASDRLDLQRVWSDDSEGYLVLERASPLGDRVLVIANLSDRTTDVSLRSVDGSFRRVLATESEDYAGSGQVPPERLELSTDTETVVALGPYSAAIWISD